MFKFYDLCGWLRSKGRGRCVVSFSQMESLFGELPPSAKKSILFWVKGHNYLLLKNFNIKLVEFNDLSQSIEFDIK